MSITVKKIAELAGVSRGTVDRVIHGRYGVDSEVREKVEQIMREHSYVPNPVAQALKNKQKNIKIGVLVPGCETNKFYEEIHKGLKVAKSKYSGFGVELIWKVMENITTERALRYTNELVECGVNGIVMVAVNTPEVKERVDELSERIPVITFNTDFKDSKRLCFVGQDHIAAGRVAGDLMGRILQNPGKIAMFISQPEMLAHVERVEGFCEVLREARNDIEFLEILETYESDEIAYRLTSELTKNVPDLVGVYVAGGAQVGVGNAIKDYNQKNENAQKIKFICFDFLDDIVEMVKEDIIDFTIGQDPFMQGYMAIKMMYEYLALGIKPKNKDMYTQIDIRVKDNISQNGYEVFTNLYTQL